MATMQHVRTDRRRSGRPRPRLVRRAVIRRPPLANADQARRRRGELLALRFELLAMEEDRADIRASQEILGDPRTEWTDWEIVKKRLNLT